MNPVTLARYLDGKEKTAARVDIPGTVAATTATLGVGAAFGLFGDAISKGIRSIREPHKKVRAYESMMAANPELRNEDATTVQRHFSSVFKLNKDFAEDPMIAGQFVRQAIQMQAVPMQQYNLIGKSQIPESRNIFESAPHVALQYVDEPKPPSPYSPKVTAEFERESRELSSTKPKPGKPAPRSPRPSGPSVPPEIADLPAYRALLDLGATPDEAIETLRRVVARGA